MAIRPSLFGILGTTAVLSVLTIQSPAYAQSGGREAQIVVDAETNEVLYESNAREARRPASITKVMTLYLLFDALKTGRISWDDRISFSRNAANQPPTKLFVGAGNSIGVQTAVEALVLRSANDVATAVAERLGGSETNFAQMMTSKARELGMSSTTFRNASGLPDASQRTTAEDLARLAIAIRRDFPDQYHWFSAQQMTYNGQTIAGHNHLMGRMQGMDGLKTGYTRASGFNLAATTTRNGRQIVTIVLGGANRFQRDDLVEALTESAYRELGIGPTNFAMNTSGYQVNFRDARDAADAAALIMDLPARTVTTGGASTIAMARSGRRLGFERGAPAFQVADMTRPTPRWPTNFPASQPAGRDDDDSATDEGEDEGARAPRATPTPTPVPFRVAVAPSASPVRTPARAPVVFPNATPTPVRVPVPVPVPVIVPPTTPLRQMAQVEAQPPVATPQQERPLIVLPPNSTGGMQTESRRPVVVFPATETPLRGSTEAPLVAPRETAEAAPVQVPAPAPTAAPVIVLPNPAPQQTQMAELNPPALQPQAQVQQPQVEAPEPPVVFPVQVAEATPRAPQTEIQSATQATPNGSEAAPQVKQVAGGEPLPEAMPTQMAQLARQDAAALSAPSSVVEANSDTSEQSNLNGSINLAENSEAAAGLVTAPSAAEAQAAIQTEQVAEGTAEAAARQAADAIALNQRRQAEASAREQARLDAANAVEQAAEARRREAARVALAARQLAARQLAERQAAERLVAERAVKSQKEKEARELALAEREAARERAVAAEAEERRQAEVTRARNARGSAIVQVGAFKERADATRAIAQFARFFPSFANGEVSTVQRRDGTWYRARFGGLGAIAAREACTLVSGRGGVCAIVGD